MAPWLRPLHKEYGVAAGFVVATTAGGLADQVGGGKFLNGAITASYIHMYNHLGHEAPPVNKDETEKSWPTDHKVVSEKFGPRTLNGKPDFHRAVDIRAKMGDNVYAVEDGLVKSIKSYGSVGQVIVNNNSGSFNGYGHVKPLVTQGQKVYSGQIIGISNGSGTNVPHLHLVYKATQGGARLDPATTQLKGFKFEYK